MKSSESFTGENSPKKESPQSAPLRDRREFLVALSATLGLTALSPKDVFGGTEGKAISENTSKTPPDITAESLSHLETQVEVFTEDEVRNMAIKDDFERAFIISPDDTNRIIQTEKGSKFSTEGILDSLKLDKLTGPLYKNKRELIYAHTHPLRGYEGIGYSPARIKAIREGKEPLPHTEPPSIGDWLVSAEIDRNNSKNSTCWKGRIYGIDGIYEYQGGASSPMLAKLKDYNDKFEKIIITFSSCLDPQAKKALENERTTQKYYQGRDRITEILRKALKFTTEKNYAAYVALESELENLTKEYETTLRLITYMHILSKLIVESPLNEKMVQQYTEFLNEQGCSLTFLPYKTMPK